MARSYFVYSYDPPIYWRVGDARGQSLHMLWHDGLIRLNDNDNDRLRIA